MTIQKIKEFENPDDETFVTRKVNKMLYLWPKKLKKTSRADYRKKISLAYRILGLRPTEKLDMDNLSDRLNDAFKLLGSQKEKYLKDIFHKIVAFEKFKSTEPKDDYPDCESDKEAPMCQKDIAWRELKGQILKQAYQQFTNKWVDPKDHEEMKIIEEEKTST